MSQERYSERAECLIVKAFLSFALFALVLSFSFSFLGQTGHPTTGKPATAYRNLIYMPTAWDQALCGVVWIHGGRFSAAAGPRPTPLTGRAHRRRPRCRGQHQITVCLAPQYGRRRIQDCKAAGPLDTGQRFNLQFRPEQDRRCRRVRGPAIGRSLSGTNDWNRHLRRRDAWSLEAGRRTSGFIQARCRPSCRM